MMALDIHTLHGALVKTRDNFLRVAGEGCYVGACYECQQVTACPVKIETIPCPVCKKPMPAQPIADWFKQEEAALRMGFN